MEKYYLKAADYKNHERFFNLFESSAMTSTRTELALIGNKKVTIFKWVKLEEILDKSSM